MYRVLCDGTPIYDLRDEDLVLINPKLELEVNKAGSFSFKMPPQHPRYDLPQKMASCIQVYQDDEEVFNGRIVEVAIDFYNRKQCACEGQLAYLNDSIQRPAEYHDMTVRGYLETLIANHNSQVGADKQFTVGIVTVVDNNDSIYRYTNYNSTMKEIKEDLVDDLGGYLRIRNVNGVAYLDYIAEYDNTSDQVVEFGENLLDFSRNMDITDVATVFIPLGAKLDVSPIEALEQRLTIESVNGGSDELVNSDAVKIYGRITKTITWDNVTTADMLLSKAQKYMSEYQWDNMTLEAKAVDLHWTDAEVEQFKLGDKVRVHSALHGLNKYFPLSKMTVQLNKLSNTKFTLGEEVNAKLTARSQSIAKSADKAIETIPIKSSILKEAKSQAQALITAATHGHVVTTAEEQLIMDTADTATATKVWRWNLNGLGYSNNGYDGPYTTAITMDGQILGDRLVGNSVSAEKLSIEYRQLVEQEIESKSAAAKEDAEEYTDEKLEQYYTKSDITTVLETKAGEILASAEENTTQYVGEQLESYYTKSEMDITVSGINTTVTQKVGKNEIISAINQTAESVTINASKINLNGVVTANSGFKIGTDGMMTATGATITGSVTATYLSVKEYLYMKDASGNSIAALTAKHPSSGWNITIGPSGAENIWISDFIKVLPGTRTFTVYDIQHIDEAVVYNDVFTVAESLISCGVPIELVGDGIGISTYKGNNRKPIGSGDKDDNFVNIIYSVENAIKIYGSWGSSSGASTLKTIAVTSSDARLKENIKDTAVTNALDQILQIQHREFDWIGGSHSDLGYIAQELEEINERMVIKPGPDEGDVPYGVDTFYLMGVITKAIQELYQIVAGGEKS